MDIFFEKYKNIQIFIQKYRKYKVEDEFLDYDNFKRRMQIDEYVTNKCIDTKKGKIVYIYIFIKESKYIKATAQFKRLMDKIPEEPADVIIITKNPLSVYINKSILKYPYLNIHNYLHMYFSIEIDKGPLCSKHEVLNNDEVRRLCSQELIIHPLSLPAIRINDPQNIWIGGEIGDVIKITSISEITGKTIRYRIVTPVSGKIVNVLKENERIEIKEEEKLSDSSILIDNDIIDEDVIDEDVIDNDE